MNMRKYFLFLLSLLCSLNLWGHSSFELHKADMYAVLGFEPNTEITAWMKYISSKMIDGYKGEELPEYKGLNFYDYLKAEFPGFKCKHRVLFHWGYNSRPWNDILQSKVEALPWGSNEKEISRFQQTIIKEQQRRNKAANALTEELFGFDSGGKDASFANAMISVVYDIHLIGDYTPDNRDFDGVQDFSSVIGDLISACRQLDDELSKPLIKGIQKIANDQSISVHDRATLLLDYLSKEFPTFLKNAQDGSLARRFARKGISIRFQ